MSAASADPEVVTRVKSEARLVTEDFVVTECPRDGVKVTGDQASVLVYQQMAQACADDIARLMAEGRYSPEQPVPGLPRWEADRLHVSTAHPGLDCWVCCEHMVIAE